MKAPIMKRYKITTEQVESLNPVGKTILEHLAYKTEDGLQLKRMETQDAYEVSIIINPLDCIEMLELKEIRDDEI